jgi:hypothetical protein
MLCDDIYIAYKTINSPLGIMYTSARHTSNGRQQTYMCSATQNFYNPQTIQLPQQITNPTDNS